MTDNRRQLDVLMLSERSLWPLDQGYRIRGYHMAQALRDLGVRVGIGCIEPTPDDAPGPLRELILPWPEAHEEARNVMTASWRGPLGPIRRRVARYLAPPLDKLAGAAQLAIDCRPRVVIGMGQHGPILLRSLRKLERTRCIWYAADELLRFHLSCMWRDPLPQVPGRLRMFLAHGLLERCFARSLHGSIGVSPIETRWLGRIATPGRSVTIRNGVDLQRFQPPHHPPHNRTAVFWGRMDFEPNIEACLWFAQRVWPLLQRYSPGAVWRIVGKNPVERVRELGKLRGIEVVGEVPDIQSEAKRAAVTLLPMRSGGGIKNKLLEAAAMGRPIIASPRAVQGLNLPVEGTPVMICRSARSWAWTVQKLWADVTTADRLGRRARQWVEKNHSWATAAWRLLEWLEKMDDCKQIDEHWRVEAPIADDPPAEEREYLLQRLFIERRHRDDPHAYTREAA